MRKKFAIITVLILTTVLIIGGCKKKVVPQAQEPPITLTYYKLFDNEENFEQIFSRFRSVNPHITINYRKFVDPEKYLDTIVSEIAEGTGPDIISVPNTWIIQNYRKLTPAPPDLANEEVYNQLFVDIAAKDNIIRNEEGIGQVYGIPLYVDNLALYYNDSHFEETIPERGRPASTWEQLTSDVVKLTQQDSTSLDNFEHTGIALGRGDNIQRMADIFYLMLLQNGINFYNRNLQSAEFARSSNTEQVFEFLTSFADEDNRNYSWNQFVTDPESAEKEIISFVTGKTSMIFGYAYLYQDIINQIEAQRRLGEDVIDRSDVRIVTAPQPADNEDAIAYASYLTEAVTRNSEHSREAWELITFMVQADNLNEYYDKEFKPTSLRSLIPDQRVNPIYGPFIQQIGISESFPIVDTLQYDEIIREMFDQAHEGEANLRRVLLDAQAKINEIIPSEGAYPVPSQ